MEVDEDAEELPIMDYVQAHGLDDRVIVTLIRPWLSSLTQHQRRLLARLLPNRPAVLTDHAVTVTGSLTQEIQQYLLLIELCFGLTSERRRPLGPRLLSHVLVNIPYPLEPREGWDRLMALISTQIERGWSSQISLALPNVAPTIPRVGADAPLTSMGAKLFVLQGCRWPIIVTASYLGVVVEQTVGTTKYLLVFARPFLRTHYNDWRLDHVTLEMSGTAGHANLLKHYVAQAAPFDVQVHQFYVDLNNLEMTVLAHPQLQATAHAPTRSVYILEEHLYSLGLIVHPFIYKHVLDVFRPQGLPNVIEVTVYHDRHVLTFMTERPRGDTIKTAIGWTTLVHATLAQPISRYQQHVGRSIAHHVTEGRFFYVTYDPSVCRSLFERLEASTKIYKITHTESVLLDTRNVTLITVLEFSPDQENSDEDPAFQEFLNAHMPERWQDHSIGITLGVASSWTYEPQTGFWVTKKSQFLFAMVGHPSRIRDINTPQIEPNVGLKSTLTAIGYCPHHLVQWQSDAVPIVLFSQDYIHTLLWEDEPLMGHTLYSERQVEDACHLLWLNTTEEDSPHARSMSASFIQWQMVHGHIVLFTSHQYYGGNQADVHSWHRATFAHFNGQRWTRAYLRTDAPTDERRHARQREVPYYVEMARSNEDEIVQSVYHNGAIYHIQLSGTDLELSPALDEPLNALNEEQQQALFPVTLPTLHVTTFQMPQERESSPPPPEEEEDEDESPSTRRPAKRQRKTSNQNETQRF